MVNLNSEQKYVYEMISSNLFFIGVLIFVASFLGVCLGKRYICTQIQVEQSSPSTGGFENRSITETTTKQEERCHQKVKWPSLAPD